MSSNFVNWRTFLICSLVVSAVVLGPLTPEAYAWKISVSPPSRTTTPGGAVTYSVSVFYDMPGPVPLNVDLLVSPPEVGVTVHFSPPSGTVPFDSVMTVHVDASKPPGTYTLDVWAHREGALFPGPDNMATSVQLIVRSAGPGQTDWRLSNPSLSPSSPNAGDPVTFGVVVTASSTSEPYPQTITLIARLDGNPIGGGTAEYPGPTGRPMNVYSTPPWPATPGTHTITWQITSGLPDPNLGNNEVSLVFTVGQPAPQFDFEISVSPSEHTATPGSTIGYTVTATLLSGTSKSVALSLAGEPPGVAGTLAQPSGNPTFSTSLTLTVTDSASPGTYTLTVTGIGGGKTHSATLRLIVGEAKDFQIEVNPPSLTVKQGEVASFSVDVVGIRGFSSPVTLSISGLPSGVNGVFSVTSGTPGFVSTLTVTLAGNVQTGSFTLTITGTGGGLSRVGNTVLVITEAPHTQTETQTQTQTQTETTFPSEDIFAVIQQHSMLVIGLLLVVIVLLAVLALRRR